MRHRDAMAPPLKIAFVGQLPPHPGGSAISVGQLAARLAALDCRVHAVAPITAVTREAGDTFDARHPELHVMRYEVPYFDVLTYEALPDDFRRAETTALDALVPRLIADTKPDLLLIGRESFAWHVPDIARAHTLPCVLLARGNPTNAILRGTYPREAGAHFLAQYRKVDLIVTVAEHMALGLRRLGLSNVTTVPNAVDVQQFAPRRRPADLADALRVRADDLVVMLVANLHRRKRPLDLVASAPLALQREPRLLYIIVGDGELRPVIEARCRELDVAERFRFTGWVDYERVPEHMSLADVVVLPSEAEGLARTYIEAQACGRVLVASDISAAREVVIDGETGFLFPVGDPNALAAAVLRAAADPALRAAIGRRARDHVTRHHAVDVAAATYREILGRVAHRASRPAATPDASAARPPPPGG